MNAAFLGLIAGVMAVAAMRAAQWSKNKESRNKK